MEFSRPEYWSGYPFPSPGDLPNPGIKPRTPTLQADSLPAEPEGKPKNIAVCSLSLLQWIFLTQELNQGLLHCRLILYQVSYQRSPLIFLRNCQMIFQPGYTILHSPQLCMRVPISPHLLPEFLFYYSHSTVYDYIYLTVVFICVSLTYLFREAPICFPGGSDGKALPAMQETWVRSLGREDPLEKEMATHSSTLAWKIPWTEKPGRLSSMGSQRANSLITYHLRWLSGKVSACNARNVSLIPLCEDPLE